jgi:PAS domain S-box-containing protein
MPRSTKQPARRAAPKTREGVHLHGRTRPEGVGSAAASAPRPSREDLWRQLFERVPEPAFVTDAHGRVLLTNPAAARWLESRAFPLDGRPVEEMVVERDRSRVRALLARLQASRRAVLETEVDLRRENGHGLSAAVTLVSLRGEGERLRAIGWLLRRLGQPRPLAEHLQRTRQEASELRLALDEAAALLGFDREGRVSEVNERGCRILARSREQLMGCTLAELRLGSHVATHLSEIRRTLARGDVWGGELRVAAGSRDDRWLHCTVVALLDEDARPSRYLAILYDVTDRRRATEQLLEQEGLARLGAMAAVVAHEVRNPLAAARGALPVIGPRVPAEGDRRILGDVAERLSRLDGLVEDILLYARPRPLVLAETDLVDLVKRLVGELRSDPQAAGLELVLEGPAAPCRTRVDAAALQHALLNLLRNASQAMGGRGRIVIGVERMGRSCRLRVRDEGPGIPDEVRQRIFEPFFTTKHMGSGLGLATARRTVQLHGGRLQLLPAPGRGTDAVIDLPLKKEVGPSPDG